MAPPSSSADRRQAFLSAVKAQKLDSVRWALAHGGQNPGTRDDEGFTAIHIAAAGNRPKVLQLMLDLCRRSRELELMDLRDGSGEDMTALMMAAANGHEACVRELLYAGASQQLTCEAGLTAEGWARKRGHAALAALISRGGEESSDDEAEAEEESGDPEETSTQRSRRKKRELAAFESRGARLKEVPDTPPDEEEEEGAAAPPEPPAQPCWPEVARALETQPKELVLERPGGGCGGEQVVDPALWRCSSLNLLKLSLRATEEGHPRPLRGLGEGLGRLAGLRTLILSHNSLETLPESIGSLTGLKVFEAAFNNLQQLPAGFGKLGALETLLLSHNRLTCLAPLASCANLASCTVDHNQLVSLEPARLGSKPRLALLSARFNALQALPSSLGDAPLLASLLLRGNALRDVPFELSLLKKLKELELEENPVEDPKIRKMVLKPASFVKELVPYLKKRGKSAAPAPAAPAAAAPSAAQREVPAAAAAAGGAGSDSEVDAPTGKKQSMSKKERAKLERKALEEKQKAAQAALQERAAAQQAPSAPSLDSDGADSPGGTDSEDEAELVRRRKTAQSFLYALEPQERERLEQQEALRLRLKRDAAAAEEAQRAAELSAKESEETEKRMRQLALKEAQQEGGVAWLFTAGIVNKVPAASLPPNSASRGKSKQSGAAKGAQPSESYYELVCELPSLMVGRIIGKGGATIKEITQRSGARISIDTGAPGMSLLNAAGRPEALESARALVNNALSGPARPR